MIIIVACLLKLAFQSGGHEFFRCAFNHVDDSSVDGLEFVFVKMFEFYDFILFNGVCHFDAHGGSSYGF